jgi:uncharacterized membrane protein (UPF0127 family)
MRRISVTVPDKATVIGDKIAVADSSWTRFIGLMGKRALDRGGGLWIKPSSGVHTCWMRMCIDVVALDSDHRIVAMGHSVPPWRISCVHWKTRSVLELPAGRIRECSITVGDTLIISDEGASE